MNGPGANRYVAKTNPIATTAATHSRTAVCEALTRSLNVQRRIANARKRVAHDERCADERERRQSTRHRDSDRQSERERSSPAHVVEPPDRSEECERRHRGTREIRRREARVGEQVGVRHASSTAIAAPISPVNRRAQSHTTTVRMRKTQASRVAHLPACRRSAGHCRGSLAPSSYTPPVPGARTPCRYGPSAIIARASGGCCKSSVYSPVLNHCIPPARCAGSSTVPLKTRAVESTANVAMATQRNAAPRSVAVDQERCCTPFTPYASR